MQVSLHVIQNENINPNENHADCNGNWSSREEKTRRVYTYAAGIYLQYILKLKDVVSKVM